jgi:hypothetical protein
MPYLPTPATAKRRSLPLDPDGESMTTQPSNHRAQATRLDDNELNVVRGGHQKFQYETTNGRIYAIGLINGSTVAVRFG